MRELFYGIISKKTKEKKKRVLKISFSLFPRLFLSLLLLLFSFFFSFNEPTGRMGTLFRILMQVEIH